MIITLIYTLLTILIIAIFYSEWKCRKFLSNFNGIPIVPHFPIVGSFIDALLHKEGFLGALDMWEKIYGDIYIVYFERPIIIVSSPELILETLKLPHRDIDFTRLMDDTIVGKGKKFQGLFSLEGEQWKMHRRIIGPQFSQPSVSNLYWIFTGKATELVKTISEKLTYNEISHKESAIISLGPLFAKYTLEIIGTSAFGFNFKENSEAGSELITSFTSILNTLMFRSLIPFNLWRYFPDSRNLIRNRKKIFSVAMKVIQERIKLRQQHNSTTSEVQNSPSNSSSNSPSNFSSNSPSNSSSSTKQDKKDLLDSILSDRHSLTDSEIAMEVLTFLLAGSETSSKTLLFFFATMAVFPEIQEKCYQEIVTVLGDDTTITPSHVEKMEFLDMCLRESWRIFAIPIIVDRLTEHDIKLGNYNIPANTSIYVNLLGMQRNSKYFPDPMIFNPERWRKNPNQETPTSKYSQILSFGGGPRVCVGKSFARAEISTTICELLRNFKFGNWNSKIMWPVPIDMGFTLQPKNEIVVEVIRRN